MPKELLISWCGYLSQVLQGPTLKLCFKGSFAAPPSSPPHPISSSLINPPRLIGFGVGNFRSVLKGTLLVHGKLLSSAGLNVDFVKVTLYEGLFAIWRLAEIDANISAERWIYIHPTFVICWVECRLVYNQRRNVRVQPKEYRKWKCNYGFDPPSFPHFAKRGRCIWLM